MKIWRETILSDYRSMRKLCCSLLSLLYSKNTILIPCVLDAYGHSNAML